MRQRVVIAMALACNPRLIIADEPTTALDVTIKAQILDLLADLVAQEQISVLLITHDMHVVARLADDILVLYAGRMAERGHVRDLLDHPAHPYTAGLLRSADIRSRPPQTDLEILTGQPPRIGNFPTGCRFHPRCPSSGRPVSDPFTGFHPTFLVGTGHRLSLPSNLCGQIATGAAFMTVSLLQAFRTWSACPLATGRIPCVLLTVYRSLFRGEKQLGLVGESGCGKSTLARLVLKLMPVSDGSISVEGHDVTSMPGFNFPRLAETYPDDFPGSLFHTQPASFAFGGYSRKSSKYIAFRSRKVSRTASWKLPGRCGSGRSGFVQIAT